MIYLYINILMKVFMNDTIRDFCHLVCGYKKSHYSIISVLEQVDVAKNLGLGQRWSDGKKLWVYVFVFWAFDVGAVVDKR